MRGLSEYSIETSGLHRHFDHSSPGANRPTTCTATGGSHEHALASYWVDGAKLSDSDGSQARRAIGRRHMSGPEGK